MDMAYGSNLVILVNNLLINQHFIWMKNTILDSCIIVSAMSCPICPEATEQQAGSYTGS